MLKQLAPQQAWDLVQGDEAVLVDLRSPDDFAQAHPKGALNLPASPRRMAERLGALLPPGAKVILFGEDPAGIVFSQLHDSPFTVLGVVQGDIAAWEGDGLPAQPLAVVSIDDIVQADEWVVLDVREPLEWEMGHVPGALLISLGTLRDNLHRIPRESSLAVICESGVRSCTAASLLQREGFTEVANVRAGTRGYRSAGNLPLDYWTEDANV